MEAAYIAVEQMWIGCSATLPQCDTSIFPNFYIGLPLALNIESRTNQNNLGYVSERTEEYRAFVREVTIDGDAATVIACDWDPIKVYRPATADQPEAVLSDVIESSVKRIDMRQVDGRWLLEGGDVLEQVEGGESLCE